MKAYYDKQNSVEKIAFLLSDRVFVYNPNIMVDKHSSKLNPQWEGPFRIFELSENSALVRFDVGGTLLDFTAVCPAHKSLRLSALGVSTPSYAVLWSAKNVYELTQGVQVAKSLQLSPASRALFFTNNSPLASTDTFGPPTEDNLVRVMLKLVVGCKDRQSAFASAVRKKLVRSNSLRQSSLILAVAERVRAELDGKKTLRSDSGIVLGAPHLLRSSHLKAAVQRIYVWIDIDNEQFKLAHQSQLVPALRDIVMAAAKWQHVKYIVLPVPYAASLLPTFASFMQQFNEIGQHVARRSVQAGRGWNRGNTYNKHKGNRRN
ncbi:hypothetical protein AAVH_26749 [Aphelenchoides avenae]|nr:hypothetical protein AAVH_26749 [Aphelenchus avenae]